MTPEDMLASLQALLPRGVIWSREPGRNLTRICSGLATFATRLHDRATTLLADAFPARTFELLPEWEATLGLPDSCVGDVPTMPQRRARVVARLSAQGGQSVPYFVAYAASLGFQIRIQEFAPARADELRADEPVYGEAWAHTWRVIAPTTTVVEFEADASGAEEPLATWGNGALECGLSRIRPAHTVIQFSYGS